ncbi:hypothetical protein H8E88_20935 [candidate division KSB1 bacterium]|nr:hypothetical protein [candidate division KSB1 bacterium]MBL7094833.1 hypothetical protein [candidate division KSB1 bacterium]
MFKLKSRNGPLIKLSALFLLISFAVWMIGSFAFLHFHTLSDGQVVSHSHIFKTSKNSDASTEKQAATHSHTKSEFLHLFLSNTSNNLLTIAVAFFTILMVTAIFIFPSFERLCSQSLLNFVSNRAPPAAALS